MDELKNSVSLAIIAFTVLLCMVCAFMAIKGKRERSLVMREENI